jgi:hypothetical protein
MMTSLSAFYTPALDSYDDDGVCFPYPILSGALVVGPETTSPIEECVKRSVPCWRGCGGPLALHLFIMGFAARSFPDSCVIGRWVDPCV